MALTTDQRLTAIEDAIVALQIAIANLASKKQLQELNLLKQQAVQDLQTRTSQLETTVQIIQDSLP